MNKNKKINFITMVAFGVSALSIEWAGASLDEEGFPKGPLVSKRKPQSPVSGLSPETKSLANSFTPGVGSSPSAVLEALRALSLDSVKKPLSPMEDNSLLPSAAASPMDMDSSFKTSSLPASKEERSAVEDSSKNANRKSKSRRGPAPVPFPGFETGKEKP